MIKSPFSSFGFIAVMGFIAFAGTTTGGRAQAAETLPYDRSVVAFGDLNLNSQQGARALYARLRNGAEDVCSSVEGRNLFFKRLWQACFDQAVDAAVVQVNNPGLTTLHRQAVKRGN